MPPPLPEEYHASDWATLAAGVMFPGKAGGIRTGYCHL
jgi:hypothetical protein